MLRLFRHHPALAAAVRPAVAIAAAVAILASTPPASAKPVDTSPETQQVWLAPAATLVGLHLPTPAWLDLDQPMVQFPAFLAPTHIDHERKIRNRLFEVSVNAKARLQGPVPQPAIDTPTTISGLFQMGVCVDVGRFGVKAVVTNSSNVRSGSTAETVEWLRPMGSRASIEARWQGGPLRPRVVLETALEQEATAVIVAIDAVRF